jgi:hypothetical protein
MSRALVRRARLAALFGVALFILMTALDYVVGVNSDAMGYARQVVIQSNLLPGQIGTVKRVDLNWFWGFRRKSGFSVTRAELSLRAIGARGAVPLVVQLERRSDTWHVVSSSIPL